MYGGKMEKFTKKGNILNVVLYIAFLLVYLITLLLYGMGHPISRYRYFFLAAAIIVRIYNCIC